MRGRVGAVLTLTSRRIGRVRAISARGFAGANPDRGVENASKCITAVDNAMTLT
jgi:hypothetical protein